MANIWLTRTTHPQSTACRGSATCPADRYVFTISLKDADIAFSDSSGVVPEGPMTVGTVYVAAPAQEIWAAFAGPCDLLHLSVLTSFVDRQFALAGFALQSNRREFDRLVMQDPVIEQIGRLLCDASASWQTTQVEALSQMVIARLLRLLPRPASGTPLPLWRLRKVEARIQSDISAPLWLRYLATVTRLSRMHFAAQFRAATGYKPHEYVMIRRIKHANILIEQKELRIVEVAHDAGFQSHSHFCKIFKRLTGSTPSGWRQQKHMQDPLPGAFFTRAEVGGRADQFCDRQRGTALMSIALGQNRACSNEHQAVHFG